MNLELFMIFSEFFSLSITLLIYYNIYLLIKYLVEFMYYQNIFKYKKAKNYFNFFK